MSEHFGNDALRQETNAGKADMHILHSLPAALRFYVNSWGRDKTQIIASRVGGESPARFLCTAEEDSVSEITEVRYPEADPLQDFGLVVAALNKAI